MMPLTVFDYRSLLKLHHLYPVNGNVKSTWGKLKTWESNIYELFNHVWVWVREYLFSGNSWWHLYMIPHINQELFVTNKRKRWSIVNISCSSQNSLCGFLMVKDDDGLWGCCNLKAETTRQRRAFVKTGRACHISFEATWLSVHLESASFSFV